MSPRAAIVACPFPPDTALEQRFVADPWYHEAYRVELTKAELAPGDLFLAIFAHHPAWMNALLVARARIGALFGLRASTRAQIVAGGRTGPFALGGTIGRWPIHAISNDQIVAGNDDKHVDFRVVVQRDLASRPPSVTVATSCVVHNMFGKLYLFVVLPLHRRGMRLLLARAIGAGRL